MIDEDREFEEWLKAGGVSDADRPDRELPKVIKTEEQIIREYREKSDYLLRSPELSDFDLEEIEVREFVEWVFEREVGNQHHVQPFEDIQSQEYQIWKRQVDAFKDENKSLKREAMKDGVEYKKKELIERKPIDYKGYACWRYNPIIFYKDDKDKPAHRLLLHEDEETYSFLEGRKFALLSPVTYVGHNNTTKNARYLYAFAFDLDGVGIKQIRKVCKMVRIGMAPMPNLITNSGHGLHLYYLLENPVPLYQENIVLLNKMKFGLTNIIWNDHTSTLLTRQHQGVLQGFRLPGTLTKFGERIRTFHTIGSPKYTIDDLNNYLDAYKLKPEEVKQLYKQPHYDPTGVTREEAARRWPEWYASKIVEGKRIGKRWNINRAVYDWWLNRLWTEDKNLQIHHRYWSILTLVIYAVKCNVPREEVLQDAYDLVPRLDKLTETADNHFTTQDVDDAMKAYDENYCTWPIETIENTTLFRIDKNRRNGRDKYTHLKRVRVLQLVDYPNGGWREGNGRKKATTENSKESKAVAAWRAANPESNNKSACARDTGLDRKTVRKWWDPQAESHGGAQETSSTKIHSARNQEKKGREKLELLESQQEIKPEIAINMAKLFAPGSEYAIEGYTHDEVVAIVTSGRWKKLGWDLRY